MTINRRTPIRTTTASGASIVHVPLATGHTAVIDAADFDKLRALGFTDQWTANRGESPQWRYVRCAHGHLRRLRDPRIAPTKGIDGWNRAQPVQGPTPVDALVNGQKLRRGLKLWTVSVSTWKADLYRRLWLGRGDAQDFPPGWVHLPRAIKVEWIKQLVAEQLRTTKDRRGFARQEWAKLRDRNEALGCAVLARAALWLLGADRYGERFWQRLRDQAADAPLAATPAPVPVPSASPSPTTTPRVNAWLSPRAGWLR